MAREVITRRHLPHWYVPGAVHFVTYRLVGTVPGEVLERLRTERQRRLRQGPPEDCDEAGWRERAHTHFFAEYDRYLDMHRDVSWLSEPSVAAMVRGNLYHHDGRLYHLMAYCIMPNHVHVLLQPTADPAAVGTRGSPVPQSWRQTARLSRNGTGGPPVPTGEESPDAQSALATIMRSLKSYTAHEANKLLRRSGRFWQEESYDHWVRDGGELARIVDYIGWNPVKAGLAVEPRGWRWCSAHDRFLTDGTEAAWLDSPAQS